MHLNWKAILFTLGLYLVVISAAYLTEKLYVPRGANDITGPPFIVMVLGFLVILFFFIRSIYLAYAVDKSYWVVVGLHIVVLLIILSRLFGIR